MMTDEPHISQIMFVLSKPSWQLTLFASSKILSTLVFLFVLFFCYSNVVFFSHIYVLHIGDVLNHTVQDNLRQRLYGGLDKVHIDHTNVYVNPYEELNVFWINVALGTVSCLFSNIGNLFELMTC